jgi:hypothetical protein
MPLYDKIGGGPMKSLSGTLLALGFVFFSLFVLLSINRSWESSSVPLDSERRVSELGLRFSLPR